MFNKTKKLILSVAPMVAGGILMAKSAFAWTFDLTPNATTTTAISTLSETFFPLWLQAIAFVIALYSAAWILIMVAKGVRWLWARAISLGGR
jgi:hypothetical protein